VGNGGSGGNLAAAQRWWWQQCSGSAVAAGAAAHQQRGSGGQRNDGIGSTLVTAAMRRQRVRHGEGSVVFRKEWYRKTGKEVIEGRPLLHRLLGSILKDVEFV
jgi:hypothetical protein